MGMLRHRDLYIGIRSHSRVIAWALLVLAALVCVFPANAQTTIGDATTGNTLFNSTFNCSGCHAANAANRFNAINAGGHIAYANTQGMGGSAGTAQQYADIAAYLATLFAAAGTQNIPYNSGGVAFTIPNIALNTPNGDYSSLSVVSAPLKG